MNNSGNDSKRDFPSNDRRALVKAAGPILHDPGSAGFDPEGLTFKTAGLLEDCRLVGYCGLDVVETIRRTFYEAHGVAAVTEMRFEYRSPGYMEGGMQMPFGRPYRHGMKVEVEMPRLHVIQVERDGKVVGVAFINKGVK